MRSVIVCDSIYSKRSKQRRCAATSFVDLDTSRELEEERGVDSLYIFIYICDTDTDIRRTIPGEYVGRERKREERKEERSSGTKRNEQAEIVHRIGRGWKIEIAGQKIISVH